MQVIAIAAVAALLCAGCAAIHRQGEPAGEKRVHYACSNGEELEMRYLNLEGVGVLVRKEDAVELTQQRSASGFIYSNGPTTVRGKGNEITVEIARMAPLQCMARE